MVDGAATERSAWVARVRAWREAHAAVAMILVAGNHDRHFDVGTLGVEVQWQSYPMAHQVCGEEINALADWLQTRLQAG